MLKPIVILARYKGMRRGNLLKLNWSEVNLDGRVITLERIKKGRRLTIPLAETPYRELQALRSAKVSYLGAVRIP